MSERNIIVANEGYFGILYVTYVGLDRSKVLGTVRRSDGAFFPPSMKVDCAELTSKGAGMRPFAQTVIGLARKPVTVNFAF